MIIGQLGRRDAPYIYVDVFEEERYSATLDKHFRHVVLKIGYSYNGPTEIGGLIVDPDYRKKPERLGLLISYVRFLFIKMHRELFRDELLAELLPPLEPDGTSHLWNALGRKFTDMTYAEADRLSKKNKEFVKGLFPGGRRSTRRSCPQTRRTSSARWARRRAASRRCSGASASATPSASTRSTAARTSRRRPTR